MSEAATVFQPSPQQGDFFNWITTGSGSCVLEAVAGAGKTTTLVHGVSLMSGWIFFGAFNKKIADEIENKTKSLKNEKLTVSTMHAAGFGMWRKVARNAKVNKNKCRDIFRDACFRHPEYTPYEDQVLALVSYAKQAALGVLKSMDDRSAWSELIEHFDVDCLDQEQLVIQLARATLKRSIERDMSEVDFDDMIYAPLVHKVRPFEYDWVLIDEAQDTNASRRALALLMLKRGGRLVAVGDRHQAIYGFTGADANALDLIGQSVNAKRLPLTVTYRCPKNIVNYARQWVSHIEAHESAPDGTVCTFDGRITTEAKPGDAVLCRFNAPIVQLAYQFIADGIPAKVEGREIGEGLKNLAKRWKVKTFDALLKRLEAYQEREVAKWRAKEKESNAVAVEDKVICLNLLITRVQAKGKVTDPIQSLCDEIDSIFVDNGRNNVVLLSTIHKSKGREFDRVFWLNSSETSNWARKDWELEQESNLKYVATTRAKKILFLA